MNQAKCLLASVLLCCMLLACQSPPRGGAENSASHGDEIGAMSCPSCAPFVGGDTSDFGGGAFTCSDYTREPLSAEQRTSEDLRRTRAMPTEQDLSLAWSAADPAYTNQLPEGSTLHVSVSLGEPVNRLPSAACALKGVERAVELPFTMQFASSDGLVAGQLSSTFVNYAAVPGRWLALADVQLSELEGSLDARIDGTVPRGGRLRFWLSASPTGVRGELAVSAYVSDELIAYDHPAYNHYRDERTLVRARFPVDGCPSDATALATDEVHAWLGGRSPEQLFTEAQAALTALPLSPGCEEQTTRAQCESILFADPTGNRQQESANHGLELLELASQTVCVSPRLANDFDGFRGPVANVSFPLLARQTIGGTQEQVPMHGTLTVVQETGVLRGAGFESDPSYRGDSSWGYTFRETIQLNARVALPLGSAYQCTVVELNTNRTRVCR